MSSGRSDADVIVVNANIHTLDPERPQARALAVSTGRIIAVGGEEDVRALAGDQTQTIDAGGRLLLPGFNDAHVHFIAGAEELVGVDLRSARDERDMVRRVADHARSIPPGEWITGGYWDHEAWTGGRLPTRNLLDEAAPITPVFVKRLDGHMALANSEALRRAGVHEDFAAPAGGAVIREASGSLTGLLKDAAMDVVTRAIPPLSADGLLVRARAALRHAAELGVTSIQDMTASAEEFSVYEALLASGELTARISSMQNYDGEHAVGSRKSDWLARGGRKFFSDGSMGSSTAAFFEAYSDDASNSGLLMHDPGELERLIVDTDAHGIQPVVHAIGDRANALVLDILERLHARRGGRPGWRPRIEHAQAVRPGDRARFARLGVVVSLQPSHCIDDMRWAEARIGRTRCATAYNVRSFVDSGAHVAFGTDWFVAPLNPMLGLYAAVTRQFADGTPGGGWFPEERIPLQRAVECYTRGSAYAEFTDDRKGMLRPGFLADLVVLSRDIFTSPAREILETRPVLTMVGGRVVFTDGITDMPAKSDAPQAYA